MGFSKDFQRNKWETFICSDYTLRFTLSLSLYLKFRFTYICWLLMMRSHYQEGQINLGLRDHIRTRNELKKILTKSLTNLTIFWQHTHPVDTGRKLNVHKTFRSWTSSERLMYVKFTSCVYGAVHMALRWFPDTSKKAIDVFSIKRNLKLVMKLLVYAILSFTWQYLLNLIVISRKIFNWLF